MNWPSTATDGSPLYYEIAGEGTAIVFVSRVWRQPLELGAPGQLFLPPASVHDVYGTGLPPSDIPADLEIIRRPAPRTISWT